MANKTEAERKTRNELCKEFTAAEILYLLGETLLLDIDEKAEIQYDDCEQPHHLVFKMQSGKILTVMVMEIM